MCFHFLYTSPVPPQSFPFVWPNLLKPTSICNKKWRSNERRKKKPWKSVHVDTCTDILNFLSYKTYFYQEYRLCTAKPNLRQNCMEQDGSKAMTSTFGKSLNSRIPRPSDSNQTQAGTDCHRALCLRDECLSLLSLTFFFYKEYHTRTGISCALAMRGNPWQVNYC